MKTIKYFIFDVFFFLSALIVLIVSFIVSICILDFVFYRRNRNFLIEERNKIKEKRQLIYKINSLDKNDLIELANDIYYWEKQKSGIADKLNLLLSKRELDFTLINDYFHTVKESNLEFTLREIYYFYVDDFTTDTRICEIICKYCDSILQKRFYTNIHKI